MVLVMKFKLLLGIVGALTFGSFASLALGADAEGDYGIRGAGSQNCQQFTSMVDQESPGAGLFVRWIEGYASGLNRMVEGTFDVSPFVGSQTLSSIVVDVCRNQPDLLVENAVTRVLATLAPARAEEQSDVLELEYDGNQVALRQETLFKAQQKLSEEGLYDSSVDGLYGPGTRRALIAFQEEAGLEATGLPDAATLIALLVDQSEN